MPLLRSLALFSTNLLFLVFIIYEGENGVTAAKTALGALYAQTSAALRAAWRGFAGTRWWPGRR